MKVERGATLPPPTFWKKMAISKIQPRFIRQKDVSEFFGVTRGFFDKHIRPFLIEIPLGDNPQSGIVYDSYDLHAHADIMKERNGRPARKGENKTWDAKQQVSSLLKEKAPHIGTLKEPSSASELDKALAPHRKKRQP